MTNAGAETSSPIPPPDPLPPASLHAEHSILTSGVLQPPSRPGTVGQIERFAVLQVLGAGGMGLVVQARDPKTGDMVAIKILRAEHRDNAQIAHRFLTEARHMSTLK